MSDNAPYMGKVLSRPVTLKQLLATIKQPGYLETEFRKLPPNHVEASEIPPGAEKKNRYKRTTLSHSSLSLQYKVCYVHTPLTAQGWLSHISTNYDQYCDICTLVTLHEASVDVVRILGQADLPLIIQLLPVYHTYALCCIRV